MNKTVGILALQGNIKRHEEALGRLGQASRRILKAEDFEGLTHLIIPGGESSSINLLMDESAMGELISSKSRAGELALFGTCAGAILLSRLGLIDLNVERNAYGTQMDSFEATLELFPSKIKAHVPFIRAPKFTGHGVKTEVLARHAGKPVLVKEALVLCSAFHPEYLRRPIVHEYFLNMIK